MIEQLLVAASDSLGAAETAGRIAGTLLFPVIGLVVLVLGLRRRRRALIILGSLVMVLSLLGIAAMTLKASNSSLSPNGFSVGECISDKEYAARRGNAEAVDCSRDDAIYELASSGDGSAKCPDGERENSSYSILATSARTYCFTLNIREGSCYEIDAGDNDLTAVSCMSSSAVMRVDRRIDGTTNTTECDAGTKGRALPEPPRLFCLVSAKS